MTTSTFGWLDHDESERRRMLEVVNLFREKGTLDELGIGRIRDTIAEFFFPGTSTIQTRARYFLFIPWLYIQIEHERVAFTQVDTHARRLQWRLVQALKAGGEGSSAGLIGIEAGENIQRLPSTIYWQGLRRWGIRLVDGSTERYHATSNVHDSGERVARSSDAGELLVPAQRNWHRSLPPAPAELLERSTFALTGEEAEFLSERIRQSCADSLLAACLLPGITRKRDARAPWELGGLETLTPDLRRSIGHAQHYSLVMEGAALLYNRMLAELAAERSASADTTRVDRFGRELDRWSDEMIAAEQDLIAWDRDAFWGWLRELNPQIPSGVIRFSATWTDFAIAAPHAVLNHAGARRLISDRERRLKMSLARLHNPRALERWSGESGLGRLTFRWGSAQRILRDVLAGLRQPVSPG